MLYRIPQPDLKSSDSVFAARARRGTIAFVKSTVWILALSGIVLCVLSASRVDATSAGGGDVRTPLHVEIDGNANVYVEGERVDTLLVCRRQWVIWHKRDPESPDLSIQLERKLIHPRHPVSIVVSEQGRPGRCKVAIGARTRTYAGRPYRGFSPDLPENKVICIRVVPPES